VADPITVFVKNVFAGIDLIPKIVRDRLWNLGCPRIKAVNDHGLHRDEPAEAFEIRALEPGGLEPRLCPKLKLTEFRHVVAP
jgi:hypothetical protein